MAALGERRPVAVLLILTCLITSEFTFCLEQPGSSSRAKRPLATARPQPPRLLYWLSQTRRRGAQTPGT